jgi:hypothetical protein
MRATTLGISLLGEIKDWGNHVREYIRTNVCTTLWTVVYIMDYVVQGQKR